MWQQHLLTFFNTKKYHQIKSVAQQQVTSQSKGIYQLPCPINILLYKKKQSLLQFSGYNLLDAK